MTVERWLQDAVADAERRNLPALKPLLETLAHATRVLRSARFADAADGSSGSQADSHGPGVERPSR
jgi:hypothetical protein